ncbi:MAG: hypothetical protein LBI42_14140 [Chitinispirillales bacterium]|jgi:hypothetical protein|nr:hypothetical protein [Chitinispirillales bacterium]
MDTNKTRDISELSKDPSKPLTQDQLDHIEEYLTLKNHDVSAKDVSISGAVDHILENLDYYLGAPETRGEDIVYGAKKIDAV